MMRGMAQMLYTAPFYAGIAYSIAAWIGRRTDLNRRLAAKVKLWEESRFKPQPDEAEHSGPTVPVDAPK